MPEERAANQPAPTQSAAIPPSGANQPAPAQSAAIAPAPITSEAAPPQSSATGFADVPADRQDATNTDNEEYKRLEANQFQPVTSNPLSTFSIDVDTAAYSNLRRFITQGQMPPQDAVRIEEMINYFKYDYPQPEADKPFAITTEVAPAPWNPQHKLARIGLQSQRISTEALPPSNLVFLIDVSGSMSDSNKLELLQSAFKLMVNQLRANDTVSIVVYAGAAGLVLPPTPGNQKDKILDALGELSAGGSTAGGEGIRLAYEVAKSNFKPSGNNRVILASDGDFNVGISSEGELVRLIEDYRNRGVFLTVLGVGMGNLKDAKMEQLADKGNGNYAYIDSILEAQKVLVSEMGATLVTIAKDVKIQVEFNPALVQAYRLIGYENRLLAAQDFNDDTKDAGELGAGHAVTALYEIIPAGVESDVKLPKVDDLKYQQAQVNPQAYQSNELMLVKLRYKPPKEDKSLLIQEPVVEIGGKLEQASNDFKFAAAVAEMGMILRNYNDKGTASFDDVLKLANQSKGTDLDGYRAEFIRLVEKARKLVDAAKS
ncbi:MAG: VWA domain-containing protein [Oscillatoriaceae cyanobacterium]